MSRQIRSGDVYRVGRAASVQFGPRPILFRVIRVHDWSTYDGWVWLDGYELNDKGDAVARRSIFVMPDGLVAAQARRWPSPRLPSDAAGALRAAAAASDADSRRRRGG